MKNKNSIIAFFIILISVFTLEILKYSDDSKKEYIEISKKILIQEANSLYQNIVLTRKWASDHSAVYVKAKEGMKPNPYLEDNHTYTKDNELLIKVNPARMTREIALLANGKSNYYYKITSINPLNPLNKADRFEEEALEFLDKNRDKTYYTKLGEDKFNYLGVLYMESSCLYCHAMQGYKKGDIVGGVRISIPTQMHNENVSFVTSKTKIHAIVTIITSVLFVIIIIYTINSIYNREKKINSLNKNLEEKVEKRTQELQIANEKLVKLSTIDDLTGIPNRRCFFEIANKAFHLAKRNNSIFSIICIDIDYFKKVNDTYGHQEGDKVLQTIASKLNEHIRKSNTLARVGGEEFLLLLNNTSQENAAFFAQKLRKEIEEIDYFTKDNARVKLTISLGITQYEQSDEDLDEILLRADEALYEAKGSGRNRCVTYDFMNS